MVRRVSDARAIEAVTRTLRWLIGVGVDTVQQGVHVGAAPPDQVHTNTHDPHLNLFLYQAAIDGALRNQPPRTLLPGETGEPALPLVLHYLLTPYVRDGADSDLIAHKLLGAAVQALNDHAVLTRTDLADNAPFSDLADQVERVRITWQQLDEKDIFSLWSIFSSPYRLSVAFEVRVVLIDSTRTPRTPLPVLTRNDSKDSGPRSNANLDSPFPEITAAVPPNSQPAALTGDTVTVRGANLTASAVRVLLGHPLLADPIPVQPSSTSATEVTFTVPATLPAGAATVALGLTATNPPETLTNAVPLPVAPKITSRMPMAVTASGGPAVITLTCAPAVRPGQQALLLLAEHAVAAAPITTATGSLSFTADAIPPGDYLTRLRIDGVDSRLVDRAARPPVFDRSQVVTVS